MRKIALFLFVLFLLFYYESYEIIDLKQYRSNKKTVEVKGEVKNPGVYEVDLHADIQSIIELAGGINEEGDTSHLNLGLDIENQGVIVVAKKEKQGKISINTATIEELDSLSGIGESIAKRIVEYRSHTPFQKLEDLMNVKGIKEKLFEKIKDDICL